MRGPIDTSEYRRALEGIDSMIMVMGETGTGKSHFINTLAGNNVVLEDGTMNSGRN